MRFTFPSRSGAAEGGHFRSNFSPDYTFQVGPPGSGAAAEHIYIQFQVRYSCTFIWTDCDPNSDNYRKERRCFTQRGKGGRTCTAVKVALISTGNKPGDAADACTSLQTAINHGSDHTLHGFHRCPQPRGFGEALPRQGGRYQGNSQPNGLYYCPRILDDGTKKRWNHSADTCFKLIDEQWITIQIFLRFGPWQAYPDKGEKKLSHVSIWAHVEGDGGDAQKLVIDNDFYAMKPEKPGDLVGKIWLAPNLYKKDGEEEHPPFYVWYRNLVISERLIPKLRQQ
jgi:hypothetical protein